ncbi:MAG: hypothetical protein ACPG7F_11535 [Aggregatilineales bacterium]
MTQKSVHLEDIIKQEMPGVTRIQAAQHLEACLICLDHHNHQSDLEIALYEDNDTKNTILLHWDVIIDEKVRRSWRDSHEATEYGATALAILTIIHQTEYVIVERAVRGTGFDYWLTDSASYDEQELFPAGLARLEVSGILHAKTGTAIQRRIREKQTQQSDDMHIPALVIVVEFSRPEIHKVQK